MENMEQKTSRSVRSAQDLRPQSFVGVVVSAGGGSASGGKVGMKDTTVVRVDRYVKNAKYKKYFVRSKKYLAHDPGNTAQVGDKVTIIATRPISKLKHFKIVSSSLQSSVSSN